MLNQRARILAYITGTVDQELLLRSEALVHGPGPSADPSCDTVSFSRNFGMIWDPDTRSALNSNTPNSATACAVGVSMKLDYVDEAT